MSSHVDPNPGKSPLHKTLPSKDQEKPSEKEGSAYGRKISIEKGKDLQGISPITAGVEQKKEEPEEPSSSYSSYFYAEEAEEPKAEPLSIDELLKPKEEPPNIWEELLEEDDKPFTFKRYGRFKPPPKEIVPPNPLEERIGDMESLTVEEEYLERPKTFVSAFPPRYTGPLTSEEFPFRETYFLTQEQVVKLNILLDGTSEVPEFKGSFFTYESIDSYGEDGSERNHNYIVTRYPSKEERETAIERKKLQEDVDPLAKFDPANAIVYSKSVQKKLQGKRVILTTNVVGGFGDINCIIKMANHMKNLGVDPKDILVIIPTAKTSSYVVEKQDFNILWGPLNGSVQRKIHNFSPDLVIMAPVLNDTLLDTIKLAGGNLKVIQIKEYDAAMGLPLGFGKGKLGAFLELREYHRSLGNSAQTSARRLTQLESVSKEIQQAILGRLYSKEAVEEFDNTSELFFGYSSSSTHGHQDFAVSITKMMYMEKSEKEPCIFLMGSAPSLERDLEEKMKGLVHEIEILHRIKPGNAFTKKIITLSTPQMGEKKRRVKLIQGPVKKEDVRFLIRASDNRVGMGTGDQSASEMFWKLVYETLGHKRRVLVALEEIAQEINPYFGKLFKNTHKPANTTSTDLEFNSDGLAEFFYAVRNDPAMRAAQLAMARKISQECSFGAKFHFLLDQLLEDTKKKEQAA